MKLTTDCARLSDSAMFLLSLSAAVQFLHPWLSVCPYTSIAQVLYFFIRFARSVRFVLLAWLRSAELVWKSSPESNVIFTAFSPLASVTSSTFALFSSASASAFTLSMCLPMSAPAPVPTAAPSAAPTAVLPATFPIIAPTRAPPPAPISAPLPVLFPQLTIAAAHSPIVATLILSIVVLFSRYSLSLQIYGLFFNSKNVECIIFLNVRLLFPWFLQLIFG